MLAEVFSYPLSAVQSDGRLLLVALTVCVPLLTYVITWVRCMITIQSTKTAEPPIVPYWIPFIGNLISFLIDVPQFASDITDKFGFITPVRVRLGPFKAYLVSSANHFDTFLRSAHDLKSDPGLLLTMQLLFGSPPSVGNFYIADDSGISHSPLLGTSVKPEHRIAFLRHHSSVRYLAGPHLQGMTLRFVTQFYRQIKERQDVQYQWVAFPDFADWLQKELFQASTYALCGPNFLALTPTLNNDFWNFIAFLPFYLKGLPRWWNPKAYAVREKVLEGIERWHRHALEQSGLAQDEDEIWDPHWGAKIMKVRYTYADEMEPMSYAARASEDLALIFALNANAVPATIWFCLELIQDQKLLARVRQEVDKARAPAASDTMGAGFDLAKLCDNPLLQSCFAETLRLYMNVALMRTPDKKDFTLGRWRFPRHKLIVLSSRTAHYNTDLWNAGTPEKPHPLNEFWADRFLVYPGDPSSGPLRVGAGSNEKKLKALREAKEQNGPIFSIDGLAGGWVPFGGGQHMCPGRFFAKNEMVAAFAIISSEYEIELTGGSKPEPDMRFFPVGMLPPKDKITFRIRRRGGF